METGGKTLETIGALKQSADRSVAQKYRAEQFQELLRVDFGPHYVNCCRNTIDQESVLVSRAARA